MHLVWKRPDGFHEALPSDYEVVDLGNNFKLWLHKKDKDQYPFRIAGGWEEKEGTVRLNNLVNLLASNRDAWLAHLKHTYDHTMKSDKGKYIDDLLSWLNELKDCPKGDTWETEIMTQAVTQTWQRVSEVKDDFIG
ncbi:hypothetical protein [Pseudobacteriovorax antillogorgiicola]|uniref:Uncharacterized protein n=1 Tax=Pseudobacteriovorax antillogorgiicola TaxID=1513793 RepID=A0A1Y6CHF0_9BACT|nr:hypothetical protein [Pseudobacteriovorax antillogorgiicola]TCS48679.1 hypothetical protein EDD56_117101 [Pseudobacteriovorax antillogorgiicola]SMF54919.1 hypothetical protein SAMN06296036_11758 [Pseudobacteriovorax antillogorgiicola]